MVQGTTTDSHQDRSPDTEHGDRAEHFRNIFEATLDAMAIYSVDGYVVEANTACCIMLGYTRGELIGSHFSALSHPDYHELVAQSFAYVLAGNVAQGQGISLRKDGSLVHTAGNASLFSYLGRPHVLMVVRDLTAHVKVEERLHETEDQYRSIFEATTDGMAIVDMTGRLVEVNPAFCHMYGYARDEMVGLPVTSLVHPDYHYAVPEGLRRVAGHAPYQGRGINVRKDGTTFYMEGHAKTFTYKGMPHVLSVIRDITDQVVAEQAILEERQRLSRDLHDSVSQALYSIALGARTARALLDPDARAIEPVEFVVAQAERGLAEMRALIFELRPEMLEQEGLVGSLRRHCQALQARSQIELSVTLPEEPSIPFAAKEALYRIAQEALHNIVKHARATRVTITLASTGEEVVLEIRDNGVGFDPRSPFPGHVGLHSMRERVERAGGMLKIESTPGAGASIQASIPASPAPAHGTTAASTDATPPA